MADSYIAVLDAGSSRARCFVFDRDADVVASVSIEWSYKTVEDASPFAREFEPDTLWSGVCRLLKHALNGIVTSDGDVAAVTVTSQRQGVVFLDSDGREIYAGPNLDLRAVFEGAAIDDEMAAKVYSTTGHGPSFLFAPAKLHWLRQHRPNAYSRIASVVTLADWLVWKLSGRLVSEPALAGEAGLLDVGERRWCTDLFAELGLPDNGHIPLFSPGTRVGAVARKVSSETGLPEGTPVVVSGPDTQCGLVGLGARAEGQVGVVAGWSAPVQMLTDRPVFSDTLQTWTGCHLLEDLWTVESSSGDAGNSYRWLADTVWGGGEDAFREMDAEASRAPAGAEGAMAFLGPSRMDMGRIGMRQGGLLFPVPLTFSDLGRGHMARAALEAMAYATRANLEQVEGVAGRAATDVAVGGGMVQTSTWVRVLADVVGRAIRVSPVPHVSALGAYVCAATAIGELDSLKEGAGSLAGRLRTVEPDPVACLEYQDRYERWLQLQDELEGVNL